MKWWRSIAAVPNPTSSAIQSTDRSVVSSSSSARSTRWLVSQTCGVVPVSARNRRANVRGDMLAACARDSTVCCSPRCSVSQTSSGPSVSASQAGTGERMNCAWPPSRCGGTTIRRATALAAAAPNSSRHRYRQASSPAAVPALVSTRSSST